MIVITDDLAAMEEILPERSMIIWTGSLAMTMMVLLDEHGGDTDD